MYNIDLFSVVPTICNVVLISVFSLCLIGFIDEIRGGILPEKIRRQLWPIHGKSEHARFMPVAVLMACEIFIYSLFRVQKDTLVQFNAGSSAEVFNFLKFGFVLPASVGFVILYSKISANLKAVRLYMTILISFAIFFALFGFVLNQGADGLIFGDHGWLGNINIKDSIHGRPETLAEYQQSLPALKYFLPVFWYWSTSMFYVFTEIWGNVGASILVFQVANSFASGPSEAGRIYPIFGIFGNIGMIASGKLNTKSCSFELSTLLVLIACGIMAVMYMYMFNVSIKYKKEPEVQVENKKKPKVKPSVYESFRMILNSRYLLCIALMVLAYNMSMNLVEVTWKGQLKTWCGSASEYAKINGLVFQVTGAITILLMFTSKSLISKCGWLFSAMITPVVLFITSALFYIFAVSGQYAPETFLAYGLNPLFMSVLIGAVQNIATKSCKYSLFDPTREMLYIPMTDEILKVRGKAAVDVIGGRLGKSGGSVIQGILLVVVCMFYPSATQMTIAPFVGIFIISVLGAWIYAVHAVSDEYHEYVQLHEEKKKG